MAEIIRKGCNEFTATCTRCGCLFRYTLSELKRYWAHAQGTVDCPQCGCEHTHPNQGRWVK